ncbi:hypothetical protein TNCV_262461 [Trichonephila clavipes]|nr:hypothetical protein TNCV_262461 [Trichonephila clavipes]
MAHFAGASMSRTANLISVARTTVLWVMTAYTNLDHTAADNVRDEYPAVSIKTIQRELHAVNIHGRVAILKPSVLALNVIKRLQWCRDHLNCTQLR